MQAQYSIGTLAQHVGVNVETIRYYHRRGLLKAPAKPVRGIRRYLDEHARRLRFIKEAQKLGFSLDEICDLLRLEDGLQCREVEEFAGRKLSAVHERIAQLRKIARDCNWYYDRLIHAVNRRSGAVSGLGSCRRAHLH